MFKRWVALAAIAIFCAACMSTSAVNIGTTIKHPKVFWEKVVVYRTADQVPGKYEEIAMMITTGSALWTSESRMWKAMQKKAGDLGANAIILDALSEPGAGAKVAAAFLIVPGADRKGKAIAIYVFPDEKK